MNRYKKALTIGATILGLGAGSLLVSPPAAQASTSVRVCLYSSSATYSYLWTRSYTGQFGYVNRGGCSSSSYWYSLYQWGVAGGFTCKDQNNHTYYDGTTYMASGVHSLKCTKNGGSW